MKTVIAAFVLICAGSVANRPLTASSLDHLQALDDTALDGTKAALTGLNERALDVLPAAATLRAEDAVAAVALRLAGG